MYCSYCYKDIAVGENYFRERGSDECYCSVDCLTDKMIYSGELDIETNDGSDEDTEDEEE